MAALTASLVFGNCCGTIIALVMPRVAPLFARKSFSWSWVYYLSTLLVLSAIGCLISVFILTRIGAFRPAETAPWLLAGVCSSAFRGSIDFSLCLQHPIDKISSGHKLKSMLPPKGELQTPSRIVLILFE